MFDKNTYSLIERIINNVTWFEVFVHEPVTTSIDASKIRHGYNLSQGAKALILKASEDYFMVVVPGDKKIDNSKLKKALDLKEVRFATPEEVSYITSGILIGGVPPFGSQFNIPTYVDKVLLSNEKIIFNCGDRRVSVALRINEFILMEMPKIIEVSKD